MENLLRSRESLGNRVVKKPPLGSGLGLSQKNVNVQDDQNQVKKEGPKSRNILNDLSLNPSSSTKIQGDTKKKARLGFTLFEDTDEIEETHKSVEPTNPDIPFYYRDETDTLQKVNLCLDQFGPQIVTGLLYPKMSSFAAAKRKKRCQEIENEIMKPM